MRLESIQEDFIEALFGGDKANAARHVIGDDRLDAEQRFGIYRGSVHGILTQAMGTNFPVCKSLVGDKFFDQMCKHFIDQYPPNTSFFAEYGDRFSDFTRTFEHTQSIPYFHDISRLEWARHAIWHQQENNTFDLSSLTELSEKEQNKIVFKLADAVRLIKSEYRIDDIWFAHQSDDSEHEFLENIDVDQPVKLFIYKNDGIIKISIMNETEDDSIFWDFIYAISKEKNLENLAEEFGESLPVLLNQAIQGNWIKTFTHKST